MSILKLMRDRQMYKYGHGVKNFNMQGGVRNYLGEQETVSDVPVKWQSGPDHPTTELAYITEAEKDLLLNQDLHNSLDGGPNRGPEGLMSLNGWGDTTSPGDFSGGSMDMGDSSYNANERTTTVDRNPDSPDSDPGQTTTVSSPQDTYGQKYTGGGFFNRALGGANKYGYTDTYGGSGANRNDTKPGYFGRAVGGLGSLLTGVPFVGGALGTAYDYGKGILGPKQKDMSQFNNLGLYEDERKQKAFNDNALYSDNYSDQKISDTSFSQKPDLNNLESIVASMDNDMMTDYFNNEKGFVDNLKTKFGNDVEEAKVTAKQKQQIANDLPQLNNIYSLKDLWDNAKTWDDRGSKGFWGVGVEEAEPMTKEEFNQELKDQGYKGKKYI